MKTEIMNNSKKEGWEFVDEYSYAESPQEPLRLDISTGNNQILRAVKARVEASTELAALWKCSNVIAMSRLGYSDHGMSHVEIVAGHSLKLLKMLNAAGVKPSCMRDYGLAFEDAEVILFMGACLHDIGHSIHRDHHSEYSLFLAAPLLNKILEGIYPQETLTIVVSEVLHCIAVHHKDSKPLTIEAGIMRVSDALDMAHGRTRLWDEASYCNNIHAVSAKAIDSVEIVEGTAKPILIKIKMTGSAGVFQIDELLRPKLGGSGIQEYVQVEADIDCEEKIINSFTI